MNKKIIGLTGVAGCGKDTFFELVSKEANCQRYSLADGLKDEVNAWTKEAYSIDALHCSRLEKEIIRPFLVSHAGIRRVQTEGRYWIDKLSERIDTSDSPIPIIQIITDIRYSEYEKDEVYWLKEELGGQLIHLSMYSRDDDKNVTWREPANEDEARNDPILHNSADYHIEWPELNPFEPEKLKPYIDDFFRYLQQ
tara:strand:+ start:26404 stop:26991 length:588 start_codon:yes stop_codon:yes gene_type:complete